MFIYNPIGVIQADCLPFSPPECTAYFKNGTKIDDHAVSDILFTLRGEINENVNREWICEHGKHRDAAFVDVRFQTDHDFGRLLSTIETKQNI